MDLGTKVKELLGGQKELIKEYEVLLKQINEDDSINENIKLKKDLERLSKELAESKEKAQVLSKENISIKISLKEQMFNERNNILNASLKKIDLYFKSEQADSINRLMSLEYLAKDKVSTLNKLAAAELKESHTHITKQLERIEQELHEDIKSQKELIIEITNESLGDMKDAYDREQRDISDEEFRKKQKHNNLEVNIGLNWINKIGIILLLFGVATAMKYTYSTWFNDYMKAISGFIMGGMMLGAGEWFNKKEKNLFAFGLCGGGIGTLYLSVFSSYFFFGILNLPVSMIISVLITLGAMALSRRYNSKTIAGISLVGGYLPFFSFGFVMDMTGPSVYIAMGYLMILTLLMLQIALNKRWVILNYLSFILNIPCLIWLVSIADSPVIGIVYGLLTFAIYLGITLVYPIRENIKLKVADLILLAINTLSNCAIVYVLIYDAKLQAFIGLLALVYALGYYGLSRFISKRCTQETHVGALFSITALTFTILMIPFQFGIEWASMGWLIQALIMLGYAKKQDVKKIEFSGLIIFGLCIIGFVITDISWGWDMPHFAIRYSLLVFGLIYVLSLYISDYSASVSLKHSDKGRLINIFKYGVLINTWIYLLRVIDRLYDVNVYVLMDPATGYFYRLILLALITIVYAYGILKIKVIRGKGVVWLSTGLLVLSNLACLALNLDSLVGWDNQTARWLGVGVLIVYNVLVFMSIKDLTVRFIRMTGMSLEFYPLLMVIYLLGVTTSFMTMQLNLANISLIISIVFVVSAMLCIVFGFKNKYLLIRRFGLGLSVFATARLFIFNLSNLAGGGRIVAYFCFGLVLMGISYIYQKLSSSYKGEVEPDEMV